LNEDIPCLPALVLGVNISESLFQRFEPLEVPYCDVWRQMVWRCRRRSYGGELRDLQQYPLIVAPVSKGSEGVDVSGMEGYEELGERKNVLRVEGTVAMRYLFQGEEIMDESLDNGEVKVGVVLDTEEDAVTETRQELWDDPTLSSDNGDELEGSFEDLSNEICDSFVNISLSDIDSE
jgi:hypothetical protein